MAAPVDNEALLSLVSLLECDVDVAAKALQRSSGDFQAAIAHVFEAATRSDGSSGSGGASTMTLGGSSSSTAPPSVVAAASAPSSRVAAAPSASGGDASGYSSGAASTDASSAPQAADSAAKVDKSADVEFASDDESDEVVLCQSPTPPKAGHLSLAREWSQAHPDRRLEIVREDDDGGLVIKLFDVELEVFPPADESSPFFVTSDDEDSTVHSVLTVLNDMPRLRTVTELLDQAWKLLQDAFQSRSEKCAVHIAAVAEAASGLEDTPCSKSSRGCVPPHLRQGHRFQTCTMLDKQRLQRMQREAIERVCASTGTERSISILLLLHVKWDEEALAKQIEEQGLEAVLAEAGAAPAQDAEKVDTSTAATDCPVCFAEACDARLSCGHGLCGGCWRSFLKVNLDTGTVGGENCLKLKCPGERCSLFVPAWVCARYLDAADHARYEGLLALSLVNDSRDIARCVADGCENCVGAPEDVLTLTCSCGHVFCRRCKGDAHEPAKCSSAKLWADKRDAMAGVAQCKQASDNKPCPNPSCGVLTHREVGCNYLVCTHCKEKWCWQCGDWGGGPSGRAKPHHVYSCNNPVNQDWNRRASEVDVFSNEGRFWFYFDRYKNHLASLKFAEKLRRSVDRMVADIDSAVEYSISDKQLVRAASELLIECRLVLAWTYVWAFFERDETRRRLFEFTQNDLETKTEQLSKMIEDRPTAEVLQDRNGLADFSTVLRGYLDNMKKYGWENDTQQEVVPPPNKPNGESREPSSGVRSASSIDNGAGRPRAKRPRTGR
eukprot:TRINITY_DN10134_c0_g2_i1.p1 TRINITY_DN10134_c0_g2~~TRINITY_DN10134_c0_g2_i1.p1  ORF type:complete len:780 (-),score=186.97 TRINITY_DN10134_c0_g2_i1:181-2520(-)